MGAAAPRKREVRRLMVSDLVDGSELMVDGGAYVDVVVGRLVGNALVGEAGLCWPA